MLSINRISKRTNFTTASLESFDAEEPDLQSYPRFAEALTNFLFGNDFETLYPKRAQCRTGKGDRSNMTSSA